MEETSSRTLEDIDEMIQLAKLNENDLLPISQAIYFSKSNIHDTNLKFLELDEHLLNTIKEGQSLYIKGDDDDNVVLCSNNQTYEVKNGETSNSLLLINKMNFFDNLKSSSENPERTVIPIEVSGIFNDYLSITPAKLHLKKLLDILNKTIYTGSENEYKINENDLKTYEELKEIIQMCETDLKQSLENLPVVTVNNKIRLLDFEFQFRSLSFMLKLIDSNSWSLDEVDYEETMKSLKDLIPEEVLNGLFDKYTVETKIIDGLQLYAYKEHEICRFFAQALLYGAGKMSTEEFFPTWRESVPEGMNPTEDMIHGIAITDTSSRPHMIRLFPEENLPEDVTERFNELFKVKEKWTVPEITPYIKRVSTKRTDVNSLLAKFARVSTVKGTKFYSAKHSK